MAAALKWRAEKYLERLTRHLDSDQTLAERHDVGVVVLTRQPRRGRVVCQHGAHHGITIGGDRDADAGTADEDSPVRSAGGDRIGQGDTVIRIVDGSGRVGAEVKHSVSRLLQVALENLLKVEAGMVRRDRDGGPRHRSLDAPLQIETPDTTSGAAVSRW